MGKIYKDKLDNQKLGATLLIQRAFKKKKNHQAHLQVLENKMDQRKQLETQKQTQESYEEKKKQAALIILKHWKNFKSSKTQSFAWAALNITEYGHSTGVIRLAEK